ncbi:MAG: helix-turn-helix domain-containing protein [Parvularculaceae bacterium]|nr:helix-turn-helix domain-containing protein [Parvularculaceae bacterium]
MRYIFIIAPDKCEYSGIATMLDLCQAANRYTASLYQDVGGPTIAATPKLLTSDGGPASFSDGRKILSDGSYDDKETPACVFVASFDANGDASVSARLKKEKALCARLAEWRRQGAVLAGVGTGVFLLAQAELLDGGEAAAPTRFPGLFRKMFPKVKTITDLIIVKSDCVLTGSAQGQIPSIAVSLYEEVFSKNLGDVLRKLTHIPEIEIDAINMRPSLPVAKDPIVRRGQLMLQANFSKSCSIRALAETLAVSQKTLARRFQQATGVSPQQYLQLLRIDTAKKQLLHTRRRVDQVAQLVGYGDVGYFRQKFKEIEGVSPAEFRRGLRRNDDGVAQKKAPRRNKQRGEVKKRRRED